MQTLTKTHGLMLLDEHKQRLLACGERCVMCALVGLADANLVVASSDAGVVVLNRFGCREGHLLVVSRRHVDRATDLTWDEYVQFQRLVYLANRAIERTFRPKRVYTAALGTQEPLPMSFAHFHEHLVPICEEGFRARPASVFSWSEGVVTYDDAQAAQLVGRLVEAWPAPRTVDDRCELSRQHHESAL